MRAFVRVCVCVYVCVQGSRPSSSTLKCAEEWSMNLKKREKGEELGAEDSDGEGRGVSEEEVEGREIVVRRKWDDEGRRLRRRRRGDCRVRAEVKVGERKRERQREDIQLSFPLSCILFSLFFPLILAFCFCPCPSSMDSSRELRR